MTETYCENGQRLLAINYFAKNAPPQILSKGFKHYQSLTKRNI